MMIRGRLGLAALIAIAGGCRQTIKLVQQGEMTELREPTGRSDPSRPDLLIVAIDGVEAPLLYGMLRTGELPGLARLVGGRDGREFPHAHLAEGVLTVVPSTSMPAWVAAFTGEPPGENGITGNEMFIREESRLALFAPGVIRDVASSIETFTEGTLNQALRAPTAYDLLRELEPGIVVWVAAFQIFGGADRLLMVDRSIVAEQLAVFIGSLGSPHEPGRYKQLDEAIAENVVEDLGKPELEPPDVLTVYLPGLDLYAHRARGDVDERRREYLRDAIDPELSRFADVLERRSALGDRFVIVVSDHGHTDVVSDAAHALDVEPLAALRDAGFRPRPLAVDVPGDHDAVFAYQGAMAFVYVADRSTCDPRCDWSAPPRFREDVIAAAEALRRSPRMRGKLDLILAREPRPYREDDAPFEVYVGAGRLEPLARHARREYVDLEARLRDLATGRFGERAGDLILIARNGAEPRVERRYYFAREYDSWHGSPSRRDSEIPLIVAHPSRSADELGEIVQGVLGDRPRIDRITPLIVRLRQLGARHAPAAGVRSRPR